MSTHVEWMTASQIRPGLVEYGAEMPDGQKVTEAGAIVLNENECIVIEGDMPSLKKTAAKILRSVQPHRHAELNRLVGRARSAASRGDSDEVLAERLNEALDVALTILGRDDLR